MCFSCTNMVVVNVPASVLPVLAVEMVGVGPDGRHHWWMKV